MLMTLQYTCCHKSSSKVTKKMSNKFHIQKTNKIKISFVLFLMNEKKSEYECIKVGHNRVHKRVKLISLT